MRSDSFLNDDAFRPSVHLTQGEKCQNAQLGGIIGCKKDKSSEGLGAL